MSETKIAWKILASPDSDEKEWLQACQIVGDKPAPPAVLESNFFIGPEYKAKKSIKTFLDGAFLAARGGAFFLDAFILACSFFLLGCLSNFYLGAHYFNGELFMQGLIEQFSLLYTLQPLWLPGVYTGPMYAELPVSLLELLRLPPALSELVGSLLPFTKQIEIPFQYIYTDRYDRHFVINTPDYIFLCLWSWFYHAVFQSSALMATPGEFLMGLKTTTKAGARLSLERATYRHFARLICPLTLWIAYALPLVNRKQESIEDIICNTKVSLRQEPNAEELLEEAIKKKALTDW
ncbi:MAG: RDD family protein [Candidatus Melainabacteria bacterium]|nr:RDD family protein [Candidatus Melainabacteria bacterium]